MKPLLEQVKRNTKCISKLQCQIDNIGLTPGPAGLTGPQGEQGIPGIDGAVGPAGLEWQGLWDADTTYAADDAVSFDGASWFCINPIVTTGNLDPSLDTNTWALLAAQGAQGLQGIQGPVGPSGVAVMTEEVLVGGPSNEGATLTKDITALNPTDNNNTANFRLPNMAGVTNAVGKEFLVHNISQNYIAQIRTTSGIYATIRQNLSSKLNGYTPQTNTINLSRGRTARFIFLGTLVPFAGANPTQTWSLELIETVRPKTIGSLTSMTSTSPASLNADFNKFLPTSATFNNIYLPFNNEDNKFIKGDSIIVANYSTTFSLMITNPNLMHYEINNISSSIPYEILPGGIVRFTVVDNVSWIAEVINY